MDVGGRGERGVKAMVRDSSHNMGVSMALSSSVGPAADAKRLLLTQLVSLLVRRINVSVEEFRMLCF